MSKLRQLIMPPPLKKKFNQHLLSVTGRLPSLLKAPISEGAGRGVSAPGRRMGLGPSSLGLYLYP